MLKNRFPRQHFMFESSFSMMLSSMGGFCNFIHELYTLDVLVLSFLGIYYEKSGRKSEKNKDIRVKFCSRKKMKENERVGDEAR